MNTFPVVVLVAGLGMAANCFHNENVYYTKTGASKHSMVRDLVERMQDKEADKLLSWFRFAQEALTSEARSQRASL